MLKKIRKIQLLLMKIAKFYFLEEILAQVTHFSQNLRPRVNLDFSK